MTSCTVALCAIIYKILEIAGVLMAALSLIALFARTVGTIGDNLGNGGSVRHPIQDTGACWRTDGSTVTDGLVRPPFGSTVCDDLGRSSAARHHIHDA